MSEPIARPRGPFARFDRALMAVLKRWGPSRLREFAFEREYRVARQAGDVLEDRPLICDWIERYSMGARSSTWAAVTG